MKLVTRALNPEQPSIGLLTSLDIDGALDPEALEPQQPWMIMDAIRQTYQVRRLPPDTTTIDPELDILLLVHPGPLSTATLYAIDQHVMRGGKIMAFLDPFADTLASKLYQDEISFDEMSSDLPGLLKAWGVDYDRTRVLADGDLGPECGPGQHRSNGTPP